MWRHPTYPDTATGAAHISGSAKMQAVMRVGALSGVGRKSCLGGRDEPVRKRDQISAPSHIAPRCANLLGRLSPVRRTFRAPDCLSKAEGNSTNKFTTITSDRSRRRGAGMAHLIRAGRLYEQASGRLQWSEPYGKQNYV